MSESSLTNARVHLTEVLGNLRASSALKERLTESTECVPNGACMCALARDLHSRAPFLESTPLDHGNIGAAALEALIESMSDASSLRNERHPDCSTQCPGVKPGGVWLQNTINRICSCFVGGEKGGVLFLNCSRAGINFQWVLGTSEEHGSLSLEDLCRSAERHANALRLAEFAVRVKIGLIETPINGVVFVSDEQQWAEWFSLVELHRRQ